ncbi:MAG: hypothetical protein K2Q22_15455, partial [Cytophagales bacterium]|nr:hypothetical protein [Cytophagales bacterium]
ATVGCSNCMAIGGVGTNSVNVGIGNPNPATSIDIGSSTYSYNAYISLAVGNGSNYRQWQIGVPYGGATVTDPYYGFSIIDATAGLTRFAISYATGYVGIGVTNPQYKLDVRGTTGNTINAVCSDGTNGTSWGSTGMKAGVYGSGGAGSTQFQAGVYGYQIGSGFNSGGVVGAYSSGTWGALGYVNNVGTQYGGYFSGNVNVTGTLSKGAGSFRIDHPLDPENKYLVHSFVESPDMMNIYNGMVTTDASGLATVTLPSYFEALNMDFRYQLTVMNEFAQAIVYKKIKANQFVIKTDKPSIEVSWQVTGIRNDPYAQKHRILVEEDKKVGEKGKYIHPEEFGKHSSLGIHPKDEGGKQK